MMTRMIQDQQKLKKKNNNVKKITKDQVKDAKELADVQTQLIENLKQMTPLIQKVEGFADKYKEDDNINQLINPCQKRQKSFNPDLK